MTLQIILKNTTCIQNKRNICLIQRPKQLKRHQKLYADLRIFAPDFGPTDEEVAMDQLNQLIEGSEILTYYKNRFSAGEHNVQRHNMMRPQDGFQQMPQWQLQWALRQAEMVEQPLDDMLDQNQVEHYIGMHFEQINKTNQFAQTARLGQIMDHLDRQDRQQVYNQGFNPGQEDPKPVFYRAMDILNTEMDDIAKQYPSWQRRLGDVIGGPAKSPFKGQEIEKIDQKNPIDDLLEDLPGAEKSRGDEYLSEYDYLMDSGETISNQIYDMEETQNSKHQDKPLKRSNLILSESNAIDS